MFYFYFIYTALSFCLNCSLTHSLTLSLYLILIICLYLLFLVFLFPLAPPDTKCKKYFIYRCIVCNILSKLSKGFSFRFVCMLALESW